MKARLNKNAYIFASNICYTEKDRQLRNYLKENAGKLVDLDTENVFRDQYNTTDGFRIYDTMISEIIDDVREGNGRCGYCGAKTEDFNFCTRGANCIGFSETFTRENTFFLKHPKGLPTPVEVPEKLKFGSYRLESFPGLGYYRLSNARKRFDFLFDGQVFWVRSIGWNAQEKLEMPEKDFRKFKQWLFDNTPVNARISVVITEEEYQKVHSDYRGTWTTISNRDDEKFLGKRTMLHYIEDKGTCLVVEDFSLKIV